ncbi:MAG: hypothetical protein GY800_09185 [Planctomycetes bacterium]|nr:hypothetical protein [Planctomycetota bacterium]
MEYDDPYAKTNAQAKEQRESNEKRIKDLEEKVEKLESKFNKFVNLFSQRERGSDNYWKISDEIEKLTK